VETYENGWFWSVPLADGRRQVTAMIDPELTGAAIAGLETLYHAELARTVQLRRLFSDAASSGAVWASDASFYGAAAFAGRGFLLVGDAGSFVDPLSSFGVKKALASAWLGAVVAHTCLQRPERTELAQAFFSNRERRLYASCLEQSSRYAREAALRHPRAFWENRARPAVPPGAASLDEADDEGAPGVEVAAAFQALRAGPNARLRPVKGVRIEARPGIEDREVVLQEAVVGRQGGAVRFVRGVHAPTLLRLLERHACVPDLFEAYARQRSPVELPDFLRALSFLVARRLLSNGG
jgi:hypothetical protein